MDLDALADLSPDALRGLLPGFLAAYIDDPAAAARNRARTGALVGDWSDATCQALTRQLADLGQEIRVHDPLPETRALSRTWCRDVILKPRLEGIAHLESAAATGPVVVLSNHLSYFDSTAIDAVLAWSGHTDRADAMISLAGPKVYDDAFRRVATSCLSTLPVPQSNQLDHTDALPPRELARRAIRSIRTGQEAQRAGRHLLIYAEGARSRTGRLGPFLPAVHRYLGAEGAVVVPAALADTRVLMGVGHTRLTPGTLSLRFGPPLPVADHGGTRGVLEAAHARVRDLLPDHLRPE